MAVEDERVRVLRDDPEREDGRYVLYLMQQSMRSRFNPALEVAVREANRLKLPVVACFGLLDGSNGFPEANARHYAFLLQGLADTKAGLEARGIAFVVRRASPAAVAIDLARRAALVVLDRGVLSIQKRWYAEIERDAGTRVLQVEGDVVVPLAAASPKHEFAARTLRPKIARLRDRFLQPLRAAKPRHDAAALRMPSEIDVSDPDAVLAAMTLDREVPPVRRFLGGEREARRRLDAFLQARFDDYGTGRARPEAGAASHMSPYLHFGQISPVEIALAVRDAKGGGDDKTSYLEELIVRRELAMNHVEHTQDYDRYETAIPDWARETLRKHARDERPHLYSDRELAQGRTHDRHWNAAQAEMRETGYMHNHMRMYWGKKILEWSPSPEEGFARTLSLNNRYFLDGRDANSFTNVAWVYGLHDRPWAERAVFGTVRYQSENSLRKFDAKAYLRDVERLRAAERGEAAADGTGRGRFT